MKEVVGNMFADRRIWVAVGGLLVVSVLGLLSWWGYTTFVVARNQRAQWAFAQALERFTDAIQKNASAEKWQAIEKSLGSTFEQHEKSSLAPIIRAYQADAMMRSSHAIEACRTLLGSLEMMGKLHPLYYPYAVKHCVWSIDHANAFDEEARASGPTLDKNAAIEIIGPPEDPYLNRKNALSRLLALAQDGKNPDPGYAWYQLWQYAVVHHDHELRKMSFAKLQGIADWAPLVRDVPSLDELHG